MALALLLILASSIPLFTSALPPSAPYAGTVISLSKHTPQLAVDGVVVLDFLKPQGSQVSLHMRGTQGKYTLATPSILLDEILERKLYKMMGRQFFGKAMSKKLGPPPVKFTVDFDTGSSDFFLPGRHCDSSCNGLTIYDTSRSSTATNQDQRFDLAYGDGSTVQGNIFRDTCLHTWEATKQAIGAATAYSSGFSIDNFQPDGLLGMAFKEISDFNDDPVFQTFVKQSVTTSSEFSFNLGTSGVELFLGGVNKNRYTGTFTTCRISYTGFWQVNMDSANVDRKAVVKDLSAIIDTGTTLIIGDTSSVSRFYKSISGSKDASQTVGDGFFTVPCDSIPRISLTFGGKAFSISADAFNLGQVEWGSSDCVGGIVAGDFGDYWIVGDVFLQNVYTVFNIEMETVGFADLA